jgi:hypothetical protein
MKRGIDNLFTNGQKVYVCLFTLATVFLAHKLDWIPIGISEF